MYICSLRGIQIQLFIGTFEIRSSCGRNRTRLWTTPGGMHCLTAVRVIDKHNINRELQYPKRFVLEFEFAEQRLCMFWLYKAMSVITFNNQLTAFILAPYDQLPVLNMYYFLYPACSMIYVACTPEERILRSLCGQSEVWRGRTVFTAMQPPQTSGLSYLLRLAEQSCCEGSCQGSEFVFI